MLVLTEMQVKTQNELTLWGLDSWPQMGDEALQCECVNRLMSP